VVPEDVKSPPPLLPELLTKVHIQILNVLEVAYIPPPLELALFPLKIVLEIVNVLEDA
jgi:hypothetical protein